MPHQFGKPVGTMLPRASLAQPGDDPSVIGWPRHRGEVLLRRLSHFAGIQIPRQEVTVTRDNPPEDARFKARAAPPPWLPTVP